jgi:hypothetical protein
MNLDFAVDRLYEIGWIPGDDAELERLPDGRHVPTVSTVKHEFGRVGLNLSVEHTPQFRCFRATWEPIDKSSPAAPAHGKRGTVVGNCEQETVIYALAQLLKSRREDARPA